MTESECSWFKGSELTDYDCCEISLGFISDCCVKMILCPRRANSELEVMQAICKLSVKGSLGRLSVFVLNICVGLRVLIFSLRCNSTMGVSTFPFWHSQSRIPKSTFCAQRIPPCQLSHESHQLLVKKKSLSYTERQKGSSENNSLRLNRRKDGNI